MPGEQTQPRPDRSREEGRELKLLHFIYNQPNLDSIRGDAGKIIDLIDEFSQTYHFMTVGREKGDIVLDLIAKRKPQIMLELGCYVGYSAILFGDAVRRAGGKRYYSLELNAEFAAIANKLVELAGLGDFVHILVGRSDVLLHQLYDSGAVEEIELLFIDHYKPAYTTDLKLCEQLGMIVPDVSVIAADNVIYPGNPPYLEYVRSPAQKKREEAAKGPAKSYTLEGFPERTVDAYMGDENVPRFEILGNPNLVYESVLRQPEGHWDAIEVTRCVGVEES
ncbi:S-adenosyl-L-methionine-dependent methyltransferase [Aspergillus egyptiacus]|nr:S-adenosyl-L-methionine-dependent methyltransferase [Aspergillus egyptiacus]